jgi:hypothetical protein
MWPPKEWPPSDSRPFIEAIEDRQLKRRILDGDSLADFVAELVRAS